MTSMPLSRRCDGCDAEIEGRDVEQFGDAYIAHVRSAHPDWPYPDVAIRNYAEAALRLTGERARLDTIGEVTVERVTAANLDAWLSFFDHDAFSDNPAWAACYCHEPHLMQPGDDPSAIEVRPWRWYRETMIGLLQEGRVYGYLASVAGRPAGWVNASLRSEYALYCRGDDEAPPDAAVIGIACFVIAPPYRRHGLASHLLDAVLAGAPARGVSHVEAYPLHEAAESETVNFRGPRSLLQSRGFEVVEQRQRDTVMRRPV